MAVCSALLQIYFNYFNFLTHTRKISSLQTSSLTDRAAFEGSMVRGISDLGRNKYERYYEPGRMCATVRAVACSRKKFKTKCNQKVENLTYLALRNAKWQPSLHPCIRSRPIPVSYTHLTLPTNREV